MKRKFIRKSYKSTSLISHKWPDKRQRGLVFDVHFMITCKLCRQLRFGHRVTCTDVVPRDLGCMTEELDFENEGQDSFLVRKLVEQTKVKLL